MPIVNGTTYDERTDPKVIDILERFRLERFNARDRSKCARLRIIYGEVETGTPWGDAPEYYGNAESGWVSRSNGRVQIPIIVHNSSSLGGGGILDHCIVRIEYANKKNGGVLYDITRGK